MELMKQIEAEVQNGAVTEYSETAARIAELKETYGTEVPDASTKDGYQRAKQIAGECTSLRTALEKRRKEFKAPVLAFGKMIDSEAKRITAEIVAIEEPFKLAYKAVDEEKKRIKAEIEQRFVDIKEMPSVALELSSGPIEIMINGLAEYDVSKATFGRRVDEASALVASTLERLTEIHVKAIEAEQEALRIEAERAELERLRAEAAERERLQREAEENAAREAEQARIAEQAAEQARIDAERKAQAEAERLERERLAAIEREEQAKRDAELAEQRRIAQEEQAKRDAELAEIRAKEEAERAAEAARQAEIKRQQEEAARLQAEKEAREANRRHVSKVCKQAKEGLMAQGMTEDVAKMAVQAIAKGLVPNVTINY